MLTRTLKLFVLAALAIASFALPAPQAQSSLCCTGHLGARTRTAVFNGPTCYDARVGLYYFLRGTISCPTGQCGTNLVETGPCTQLNSTTWRVIGYVAYECSSC